MQDFALAAKLFLEVQQIYAEEKIDPDDARSMYFKNVFACLLTHTGRYDDAEKYYQEEVQGRSSAYGVDSLELADTYNDLGFHFRIMKRFEESEKYFRMF